jgi:sigma-B regulation protein RsbU (phosphoserine phosphatase)
MSITSVAVEDCEWNEELQNAHAIQQHLLAHAEGVIASADCSAVCRQANAVGGDFYDFLNLCDGRLGIAIGDVAGKGVGAALLMANLQATLRAEARSAPSHLAAAVASVNREFHKACFEEGYATLFYAVFDPPTRVLNYVNAGHNPPFVKRVGGSVEWLESGGAPVGMFRSWLYEEGSVVLNPGDVLVAYTDGIVEARDCFGEEWGSARLAGIVEAADDQTAAEISARIWSAVDGFVGSAGQADDMTSVVVRPKATFRTF